jgi:hypothetical protein
MIECDFDRRWGHKVGGPYRSPRQLCRTFPGRAIVLRGLCQKALLVGPDLDSTQDRLTPPVDDIVLLDDVMPFLVITNG